MLYQTKLFKRISAFAIPLFIAICWINCAFAQDPVNGSLDIIFQLGKSYPQYVIWLENEENQYIETLYITGFIGHRGGGNRTDDPDIDSNLGNRLSSLPIWAHKRNVVDTTYGINSYYPPKPSAPSYPDDIDGISHSTPGIQDIQTITWPISDYPAGIYNCWIEINTSYDVNTEHIYSYYRGQPSLVWKVAINISVINDTNSVIDYFGYGSPDGSDGNITPADETITTAANLLSDMGGYKFKAIYTSNVPSEVEQPFSNTLTAHSFILNQNYPNPFNPSTLISYTLSKPAHVVLKVIDIHGTQVRRFVGQHQTAGHYQVHLDAKHLASGVYFYQLVLDNKGIDTKKMLLLR
ncbi:T9SS type A sorting domain-containing protein [bacterium]